MTSDDLKVVRDELDEMFGTVRLTELKHSNQYNQTWRMDCRQARGIVKQYRWLTPDKVDDVLRAEARVAAAGVPVPPVLHRCEDGLSVVYEFVDGAHLIVDETGLADECASLFVRQLAALDGFLPSWPGPRPAELPSRARRALDGCREPRLGELLSAAWVELCRLAEDGPVTASHVDWRSDNLLFAGGRISAVLDWEGMVRLPAAEAIGYAASSFTHSWRDDLYQPLTLSPVVRFLETAPAGDREHALLAARFACGIRLAEDGGNARVSVVELTSVLGS